MVDAKDATLNGKYKLTTVKEQCLFNFIPSSISFQILFQFYCYFISNSPVSSTIHSMSPDLNADPDLYSDCSASRISEPDPDLQTYLKAIFFSRQYLVLILCNRKNGRLNFGSKLQSKSRKRPLTCLTINVKWSGSFV